MTPVITKLIDKLKKKYPDVDIKLVDNYQWLRRDDLKGTYTLAVSTDASDTRELQKDIDKIYKLG